MRSTRSKQTRVHNALESSSREIQIEMRLQPNRIIASQWMRVLYANTHYAFELTNIYHITQAYLKIMYAKEGMKNRGRGIFILAIPKWVMNI